MPAQLMTVYDNKLSIGSDGDDGNSFNIRPFDLGDLNTQPGLKAILLFKLKVVGAVNLTMSFNNHPTPVMDAHAFVPEPASMNPRSWHETFMAHLDPNHTDVPPNLKKNNNILHISADGPGHVEISDIELFYHGL